MVAVISRAFALVACLTAIACSSSLVPGTDAATGGRGGGQGGSGDAGTTGAGGTGSGQGGTGGSPACVGSSAGVSLSVRGEDGMPVSISVIPVTAPVTVVSVDDCATGSCASSATSGIRIIVSESTGRRWTLDAYFPGLPVDIVSVGEALDLRMGYTPFPWVFGTIYYWTAVLARGGTAVVFDDSQGSVLETYGITVARSDGAGCFTGSCFSVYGADVTYGTETRSVAPSQTVSLGKLTFTHRYFREPTGGCDPPPYEWSMAGFTVR